MISRKYFFKSVLFAALILPLTSNAIDSIERQFTLTSSDAIAIEVMTGKIMTQLPEDFNGEIKLIWTNVRFENSAQALRNMIIGKGISPYRIKLIHNVGGYREHGGDGVQIIVQQLTLRLPECIDKDQNYHFDIHTDLGCSLDNIRKLTLVNPYQYNF